MMGARSHRLEKQAEICLVHPSMRPSLLSDVGLDTGLGIESNWILDSLVLIFHVFLFSNLMISPWLLIRTTREAFKKMPRPPR